LYGFRVSCLDSRVLCLDFQNFFYLSMGISQKKKNFCFGFLEFFRF
jgi:hypothetical protein